MKNKKITYLLLGLVALIWGYFFYVLFGNSSSTPVVEDIVINEDVVVIDSITLWPLNLNYSDPFLKRKIKGSGVGYYPQAQPKKSNQRPKPKVKPKPAPQIVWPLIEYGGTVNKTKGLVKIRHQLLIVNQGENANDVSILKIYPDSIVVAWNDKVKTFYKNK